MALRTVYDRKRGRCDHAGPERRNGCQISVIVMPSVTHNIDIARTHRQCKSPSVAVVPHANIVVARREARYRTSPTARSAFAAHQSPGPSPSSPASRASALVADGRWRARTVLRRGPISRVASGLQQTPDGVDAIRAGEVAGHADDRDGGAELGASRWVLTRIAAATTLRPDAVGLFRRHAPGPARSDTMVAGRRFRQGRNRRM